MKQLLISIFFSLLTYFSFGQVSVTEVSNTTDLNDKQGVFYALPYNYITVRFEMLKTEYIAGPYAEYASKYLDLQDVITSDYNEYSIKDARLDLVGTPDPGKIYFAEFTDKISKEERAVLLTLSETGMINSFDGNVPASSGAVPASTTTSGNVDLNSFFAYFAETNLYEFFDTIIRKVVVDTVSVEKVYLDRKWVEKTDEQKAIEAANKISRIRDARYNLLTGYHEIAYESGTLKYMDEQLVQMENEYLSLFTGISIQKRLVYKFTVDPGINTETKQVPVCVFSERSGIKEVNAAGGERIYLKMDILGDLVNILPVMESKNSSANNKGFYYRMPVLAKLNLSVNQDIQVSAIYPISQFGVTTFLPPTITKLQLHQVTGALKSLKIE